MSVSDKEQARALVSGIRKRVVMERTRPSPMTLEGQPFDSLLLSKSLLYRSSRARYLEMGGRFVPALVSSPRTLGSAALLEPVIEYSPVAREMEWTSTDPIQSKEPLRLLELRNYVTSVYHEQNHRLLWKLLPPPPSPKLERGDALRRYLNLAESLVVVADIALGDELGEKEASFFHLAGAIYDPGSKARGEKFYRSYLLAALHATFLNLEGYEPDEIMGSVPLLHGGDGVQWALRATSRALELDRKFVERTNPIWQHRHAAKVATILARADEDSLVLPADPRDFASLNVIGSAWLAFLELG